MLGGVCEEGVLGGVCEEGVLGGERRVCWRCEECVLEASLNPNLILRVCHYSCAMWLLLSDVARVALEGGPTHTVPYGETLTVQCSVTNGREDVTWSWFSDGEKLVTDARGDVAAGSLSLRDTVLADAGFYQCFATNLAGSSVAVATVAVVSECWWTSPCPLLSCAWKCVCTQ